ncbi:exodeoxyribonuclease V subunit gamma, partial [Bacillus halotolerans]|nr:exodeoxyribonuclease V subunit gamma [Bacillus halotolerans]
LQFLRRLGQYLDVVILHYNPSQEYWADSVDPLWKKRYDLGVKERYIAKHPNASDADIAAFFDSFSLGFNALSRESRHPLLTRLGKQARDHFSLLSQLATGEEGKWVDAFVEQFPETLLGKIQSDIFYLAEPQSQQY